MPNELLRPVLEVPGWLENRMRRERVLRMVAGMNAYGCPAKLAAHEMICEAELASQAGELEWISDERGAGRWITALGKERLTGHVWRPVETLPEEADFVWLGGWRNCGMSGFRWIRERGSFGARNKPGMYTHWYPDIGWDAGALPSAPALEVGLDEGEGSDNAAGGSLEGKTVARFECDAARAWRISFTDGTVCLIEIEGGGPIQGFLRMRSEGTAHAGA